MDRYQAMFERHMFYSRMESLLLQYYRNLRCKIEDNDPDAAEKRSKINEMCLADIRTFRRHFFGKKWVPMCQFCNYYDYWETHYLTKKAGGD